MLALLAIAAAARNGGESKRDGFLSRVATRATGAVVDIVDPDLIIDQVDVDALMERVDVNALLERVDPDIILDNVDVNALMDRVDVDTLLDRVDVNALLGRVDVNSLMDRVDVDAILDRVDVKELTDRAGIPDIVRDSTGELAGSAMDIIRRQIVALDAILGRMTYHLIGRDPTTRPTAPPALEAGAGVDADGRGQVTGHYAGPVSRIAAFVVDSLIIWGVYVLTLMAVAFLINFFFGTNLEEGWASGLIGALLGMSWAFGYFVVGLALAGRTVGMGIVGLSVVTREGSTINGGQALIRTIVFPFSFVFFLGFLGIFTSPERRSLHDAAAGSVVVYDWGERAAEMPAPFTAWMNRHAENEANSSQPTPDG